VIVLSPTFVYSFNNQCQHIHQFIPLSLFCFLVCHIIKKPLSRARKPSARVGLGR
jgi:hypothetical protein